MTKRVWTFGAVLMLTASTYLYLNLAQGIEVVAEIDQLLAKGKEELEPCQNFRNKLEKLERAGLDSNGPSHASKEEALAVLDLLETYPGTPPSHYKAAVSFGQNHELLASRLDQIALRLKVDEIQGECDMVGMLKHGSLLLKDTKVFHLDAQETGRVRGLIVAYLKSEMPAYSMIALAMRGTLLERLLEATHSPGNGSTIARARGFLRLFKRKSIMLAEEQMRNPRWRNYLLSSRAPELQAVHELGAAYGALLKEARI